VFNVDWHSDGAKSGTPLPSLLSFIPATAPAVTATGDEVAWLNSQITQSSVFMPSVRVMSAASHFLNSCYNEE
jgi:hypothetical protein